MDIEIHIGSFAGGTEPCPKAKKIVTADSQIKIRFSYPLTKPTELTFESVGGFTTEAFVMAVCDGYRRIYDEEERTATKPAEQVTPWLYNRNQTDGVYGIAFHDLGDLYLEGFRRGSDGIYELDIGS